MFNTPWSRPKASIHHEWLSFSSGRLGTTENPIQQPDNRKTRKSATFYSQHTPQHNNNANQTIDQESFSHMRQSESASPPQARTHISDISDIDNNMSRITNIDAICEHQRH
mmetsp:Transcript_10006/g.23135  ORF Transcript_10006/g.23135 Transcript_10006/m.23135 type:complete len:111 (+) Transcript_10006:495-827(+)